jgi:hypothetical protein
MAKETAGDESDQSLHEQFLGLLHGHKFHRIIVYTEYNSENAKDRSLEYWQEATFCRVFSFTLALCNKLGNFWAYRVQFLDASWKNAEFSFQSLLPPPWTIKKWLPLSANHNAGQPAQAAVAAQWEPITGHRCILDLGRKYLCADLMRLKRILLLGVHSYTKTLPLPPYDKRLLRSQCRVSIRDWWRCACKWLHRRL